MDHGRGKRDGCGSGINFTEVIVVFTGVSTLSVKTNSSRIVESYLIF